MVISVTRFDEICKLGTMEKTLAILKGFIGQNFRLTSTNISCYWGNYYYCKLPNFEQITYSSGHTDGKPTLSCISMSQEVRPLFRYGQRGSSNDLLNDRVNPTLQKATK